MKRSNSHGRVRPAVIEAVQVFCITGDLQITAGFVDPHHRLKEVPHSILDELAKGMKICREDDASRVEAPLVFSFTLPKELFPPLSKVL